MQGFVIQGNEVMSYYDLEKSYYAFDHTMGPDSTQEEIYKIAVANSVNDVFTGINSTVMAYGQTGAGKTYTMLGPGTTVEKEGAIVRACAHIFGLVEHRETQGVAVRVNCSCLQIYNETVLDMLDPSKSLKVRETPDRGVWVDNLTEVSAVSQEELLGHVRSTEKTRRTGTTDMSERSSRSHSVYVFLVTQDLPDGSSLTGKLCLVDLAGSEKVSKSGVANQALIEAKTINKSLSALGNCIQALVDKASSRRKVHVPYRDSKLTHILQDSLGGLARQSLIVACSMHWSSYEETISSMRFASRAKLVKSVAASNATDAESRISQELASLLGTATQLEEHLEQKAAAAAAVRGGKAGDNVARGLAGSLRARCGTLVKLEKQRGPDAVSSRGGLDRAESGPKGIGIDLAESEARCQMLLAKMAEQEEEIQRGEAEMTRSGQIEEEAQVSLSQMQDEIERLEQEIEHGETERDAQAALISSLREKLRGEQEKNRGGDSSVALQPGIGIEMPPGTPDESKKLQVEVMRLRAKCEALQARQLKTQQASQGGVQEAESGYAAEESKFENVELKLKYDENRSAMAAMERTNKMLTMQIEAMRTKASDSHPGMQPAAGGSYQSLHHRDSCDSIPSQENQACYEGGREASLRFAASLRRFALRRFAL